MSNLTRILLLLSILSTGSSPTAQTGDFNHRWTDPTTAIVLDPFEGNSIDWNTSIAPTEDEVMALDIESLDADRDMNLVNARRFLQHIKGKTGRYPMLYANHAVLKEISLRFPHDEVFLKAPLWYARFKSQVTDFPTGTWDVYTLWQFSSEINCTAAHPEKCLYRVPGTKTDMDINVYRGSVADLRAKWPF